MITSCAIFTLGLDEKSFQGSISKEGLDTACMTSLWLFFSGQILSFTAVYCKLRRLDKVLTFRRIKVTAWKASLPLILFLTIASLVLIVWTVVDPWTWERQIVMLNPFETYGFCSCENFFAFFATLMGLLGAFDGMACSLCTRPPMLPMTIPIQKQSFFLCRSAAIMVTGCTNSCCT